MRPVLFPGLLLLLSATGCGGPRAPERVEVYGTVSYEGQPVEEGTISFLPAGATSGPSAGGKIADGKYEIREKGPLPGTYRVEIKANRTTGKQIEVGPPAPPGTMVDEIEQFIPDKYNDKSELTIETKPGRNEHNFDLQP